nr:glutamine synthetase cytosolic isozyme 2 [Tanacetum cinerariifolium]
MRADGGYEVIKMAIGKLKKKHIEHIAAYGEGKGFHNDRVWPIVEPRFGLEERPREKRTGYFEDRRPLSNMDPYVATSMISETTII